MKRLDIINMESVDEFLDEIEHRVHEAIRELDTETDSKACLDILEKLSKDLY